MRTAVARGGITPLMCFSGALGGEMRLHLSDSNAVFSPCHESNTYPRHASSLRSFLAAVLLLPLRFASGQQLPNTTRLLRFPTTNGDQIVFCYAGELYTVGKTAESARRLTSGPGYTSFPRFSPDGKQLAFTSQYDGNTEVYVMPGDGGEPKRLTTTATLCRDDISDRMGPNNIVMGWENTQPLVVFRSRRTSFNSFIGDLETVGLNAELPQAIAGPARRLCFLRAGRFEDGFQPRLSRIPHLETLPRRHGGRRLDFRLQDSTDRKSDEQSEPRIFARCGDRITTSIFSPIATAG